MHKMGWAACLVVGSLAYLDTGVSAFMAVALLGLFGVLFW